MDSVIWVPSYPCRFDGKVRIAGRRLRLDEALFERFAMSRAGNQFALHLAPRIDKVLIPRTKGRLSAMGFDKVGLVTSTGRQIRTAATHPLILIDDSDGLLAIRPQLWARKSSGLEEAAGAPRMHC